MGFKPKVPFFKEYSFENSYEMLINWDELVSNYLKEQSGSRFKVYNNKFWLTELSISFEGHLLSYWEMPSSTKLKIPAYGQFSYIFVILGAGGKYVAFYIRLKFLSYLAVWLGIRPGKKFSAN